MFTSVAAKSNWTGVGRKFVKTARHLKRRGGSAGPCPSPSVVVVLIGGPLG